MKLTRRRFLGLLGGGIAAGGVYVCGVEPLWLETRELELSLPRLPEAFDGYRIVQLSDLHVGPAVPRWHLDRAVEMANSFSPDLIAVTGDLVDHLRDEHAPALAADILGAARAADGVMAVPGNHDTGAYHEGGPVDRLAVPRMREALSSARVSLLENQARMIERGGARLCVAGFGDLWSGRFERAAVRRGECTIALSHNPDTAPDLARAGTADLVLSGHTHGGQIRFPVFGPPWIPLKHKQFLKGHFRLGDTHLYVNRGLGWTHRIRLRARPELTVFTLRARRLEV